MKTKLTFSGGWHRCSSTSVYVDIPDGLIIKIARAIEQEESGDLDYYTSIINADYMSKRQRYRLWRHFCGMHDCCCGSYGRADIDYTDLLKNAKKLNNRR